MPYIELNTNIELSENLKEEIKEELEKKITLLHKTKDWLMISLKDKMDIYFKGNEENALMLKVFLYGSLSSSEKFTNEITSFLTSKLGINKSRIYVAYFTTNDWGWNGSNF